MDSLLVGHLLLLLFPGSTSGLEHGRDLLFFGHVRVRVLSGAVSHGCSGCGCRLRGFDSVLVLCHDGHLAGDIARGPTSAGLGSR